MSSVIDHQEQSLRYLLLRTLSEYSKPEYKKQCQEIAQDLTVKVQGKMFLITWKLAGEEFSDLVPKSSFELFVKGDSELSQGGSGGRKTKNYLSAMSWLKKALPTGIKASIQKKKNIHLKDKHLEVISTFSICLISFFILKDGLFGLLLFAIFAVEFFYKKGKFVSIFLFLPIIILKLYASFIILAGLFIAFYHFLDPDPRLRTFRVILSLGMAITASILSDTYISFSDPMLYIVLLLSLILFLFRWPRGSHFRFFPLILSFLPLSFYLEGEYMASAICWAIQALDCFLVFLKEHRSKTWKYA